MTSRISGSFRSGTILWELTETIGGGNEPLHHEVCVHRRVLSDVSMDRFEVANRAG